MTILRLLNETSVSREAEEYFIEQIRVSQGFEQVTKLKKMFTDIDISSETMKEMLAKEKAEREALEENDEVLQSMGFDSSKDNFKPSVSALIPSKK